MSTEDFIKKMDRQIASILKENKPLALGVKSIMAIQSKRIWLDGKNKYGANIGEYKGGEIYVSPKAGSKRSLPAFPLKGKTGETTFKNGKKHKTGYFKSYPEFKKAIGRNKRVKSVDLFLTGTLQQDWANAEQIKDATATKINPHNYVVSLSKENTDKVERYGVNDVFGPSTVEKGKFLGVVQFELAKALRA